MQPVTEAASAAVGTVAKGAAGLFSGLPLYLLLGGVAVGLAGAGGTVWYRMKWLDEVAAGAQAVIDQQNIDRSDNAKAIGQLTNTLNANKRDLEYAQGLLANIPRNDACLRDQRINAVRDILCRKYPTSEACSGPRPSR